MTESLATVLGLVVSGSLTVVILTRAAMDVWRRPIKLPDSQHKS